MKIRLVTGAEYTLPTSDPITKANTASGAKYHSDGQMLVLFLKDNEQLRAAGTAAEAPH